MCIQKNVIIMSKLKFKNRLPSNEEFKSKMHWLLKKTKCHDFCHFVIIYSLFHIEVLNLHMIFGPITCLVIFKEWNINIYDKRYKIIIIFIVWSFL